MALASGSSSRRRLGQIVVVVVVLVAAGAAYWEFGRSSSANKAAVAAPSPPPVTVSQPLQHEVVEWDEFTGQFAAVDYVELRARVSGYLTEIHFEDGQIVHQGDLLFVIDPRPYEATLASMRAQLGQAQAQVDLAFRQLGRSAE